MPRYDVSTRVREEDGDAKVDVHVWDCIMGRGQYASFTMHVDGHMIKVTFGTDEDKPTDAIQYAYKMMANYRTTLIINEYLCPKQGHAQG